MLFYIKSVKVNPKTSWSTRINNKRGRGHDLCLRFFEKVQSFTPFDGRSGIRLVSGVWVICQCRCPPLVHRTTTHPIITQIMHGVQGQYLCIPMMSSWNLLLHVYNIDMRVHTVYVLYIVQITGGFHRPLLSGVRCTISLVLHARIPDSWLMHTVCSPAKSPTFE
jgi:hypothetical protein